MASTEFGIADSQRGRPRVTISLKPSWRANPWSFSRAVSSQTATIVTLIATQGGSVKATGPHR